MDVDSAAGFGGTGSAGRRRERLLRQHWRRAQLSLQMLLATFQHHAAPRGKMQPRSGTEESEMYDATGLKTPPPPDRVAEFYVMSESSVELGGGRPAPLVELVPSGRGAAARREDLR